MYQVQLIKEFRDQTKNYPIDGVVGKDPVTLFNWAKKKLKLYYANCKRSNPVLVYDPNIEGTCYYTWAVVCKKHVQDRFLIIAKISKVEVIK